MVCGTFTSTAATKADADQQAQNYRDNDPPPTGVSVVQAADGAWTVTATWPPCPAGTTHSAAAPAVPPAAAPALFKGFDANQDCGRFINKIQTAKLDFVARYYSHTPSKNITSSEARLLSDAGLNIVSVWEALGNVASSFSHASGVDDATSAYNQATALGQPGGTPIYFAVDFDAEPPVVAGAINDYFQGVAAGFATISHNNPAYGVGVYGSGLVCSWLSQRKLATYTWLSQSMGWNGSRTYEDWNICQHLPADPYGFGFSIDPDDAKPDYGGFRI